MNIALEKTEEYVNGVKRRTYGDAFVRGNNGESCHFLMACERTNESSHVHLCRVVEMSILVVQGGVREIFDGPVLV